MDRRPHQAQINRFDDLTETPKWRNHSVLFAASVWSAIAIPTGLALIMIIMLPSPTPITWILPAALVGAFAGLAKIIKL